MTDREHPPQRSAITLSGTFTLDGDTVYIGGMSLAEALRASLPHYDSLEYQGKATFPDAEIRVQAWTPKGDGA